MPLPPKALQSLNDALGRRTKRKVPLWKGPSEDGITFSMLSRFLCCRERFRITVIEGLKPTHTFNHRIEYGNMWHICEEALASEVQHFGEVVGTTLWGDNLLQYARDLGKEYPLDQSQIDHWYRVCKVQFPLYVQFWNKHKDVVNRTPLLQEKVFDVPYPLPSGRIVRLRGKWDSVDLIKGPCDCGADRTGPSAEAHDRDCASYPAMWLQENKTKGDIKELQIQRQLKFDLQTMMYIIALTTYQIQAKQYRLGGEGIPRGTPIAGVRYNVIRRPLSGGKGTIVRHKAKGTKPEEAKDHFYDRVGDYIKEEPQHYFMRWNTRITAEDIQVFRRQCLDPILESLCQWWEYMAEGKVEAWNIHAIHWRHPFGVYNVLDEGGSSDLDEYLTTGSEVGLSRVESLFPELE